MNKIVRILPGIFLSLLSLSSCDGQRAWGYYIFMPLPVLFC